MANLTHFKNSNSCYTIIGVAPHLLHVWDPSLRTDAHTVGPSFSSYISYSAAVRGDGVIQTASPFYNSCRPWNSHKC